MIAAVSSPAVSSMSATRTAAPSCANCSAIARPMPWPAPVTIEILSLRRIAYSVLDIHQHLSCDADFRSRDGIAAEVGDVHRVAVSIADAEGHVGGTREEDRPAVVGEELDFPAV